MDALYDHAGRLWVANRELRRQRGRATGRSWTTTCAMACHRTWCDSLFRGSRRFDVGRSPPASVVHFAGSRIDHFGVRSRLPDAPASLLRDANGVVYVGTRA